MTDSDLDADGGATPSATTSDTASATPDPSGPSTTMLDVGPAPITSTTRPTPRSEPGPVFGSAERSAELVLAHVHLRLGSLALARAELETLAGRDALDDAGLVDLAEARWRTGDVAGAGEAAAAVLGEGEDGPLVTLVIAAEAALLRGRPSEARRYATQAMQISGGGIDALFAGMPRGPVWPADSTVLSQPAPTLFDGPDQRRAGGRATGPTDGRPAERPSRATTAASSADGAAAAAGAASAGAAIPLSEDAPPTSPEPATIALWASLEAPEAMPPAAYADVAASSTAGDPDLPAGDEALHQGREALAAGDLEGAAVHLALALRLTPGLAPAVLDVIDGRTDRDLAFVRGDAYRLVGREREARRAFADAMRPIPPAEPPSDHPPEGDPA